MPNDNFMVAFSALKTDKTPLNDLRYAKWVANFMIDDEFVQMQELSPCNEAQLANFYPPKDWQTEK